MASSELAKEYLEVHFDEKSIVVDDHVSIKGYGPLCQDGRNKRQVTKQRTSGGAKGSFRISYKREE